MRRAAAWTLVAVAALASGPPQVCAEEALLRVQVGPVDGGDRLVELTPEGDVLVPLPTFQDLGFRLPPAAAFPDGSSVSLRALAPEVSFEVDRSRALLRVEAAPSLLRASDLDFGFAPPTPAVRPRDPAVFLTGEIDLGRNVEKDRTELHIPWDATASVGPAALSSGFDYARDDEDTRFTRLLTQATVDFPERMERLQLGDANAASGRLGGAATLGGVSFSRAFFMQPSFRPYPGREFLGTVTSPSRVEVYANGVFLGSREVLPGEFTVRGLPTLAGAGEVEIVVTDDGGNREVIQGDYYNSTRVLRRGLHDYSYTLGFVRDGLGSEDFDYGRLALMGFQRFGVTDLVTAGGGVELSADRWNVAPDLTWNLDGGGELALTAAASGDDGDLGAGLSADYQYSGVGFSVSAGVRALSREFSNVSRDADDDKEKFSLRLGGGLQGRLWGAASAAASLGRTHEGSELSSFSLSYSKALARGASLFLRATRVDDEEESYYNAFLGVRGTWGGGLVASANYSTQYDQTAFQVRLKKDLPTSDGFGFDAGVRWVDPDEGDGDLGGDAAVRYQSRYGIASATVREGVGTRTFGVGYAGSVAWVGNSVHLSRPIYDSFALVKVADAPDVGVLRNNQPYGATDGAGELLVAGLASYSVNSVGIEVADLPLRYRLAGAPSQALVPAFRSGALVEIPAQVFQAVTGRAFLVRGAERTLAEYAAVEVDGPDGPVRSVVGRRGEFYLENVPAGPRRFRFELRADACETTVEIPASEEMFVDLGEVTCEIR